MSREKFIFLYDFYTDSTMNNEIFPGTPQETAGIPAQGAQVVPVYQGLKAKKPLLEEGKL